MVPKKAADRRHIRKGKTKRERRFLLDWYYAIPEKLSDLDGKAHNNPVNCNISERLCGEECGDPGR